MRTLIVNGEDAARAQLHRLCADRPDLDVVAEATNGAQAIDVIQGSDTELLLLDARLPDMSGFELLRALTPEAAPATIMVSTRNDARQQPAGINVNYLYKPVDPPQFHAAVDHAIGPQAPEQWTPQIIGEKSGRIYFLEAHEVEFLESAGNYVVAHVGPNGFLARATLKCMSARLAPLGFVQIERSLLVNLRQVAHVERQDRGQFCFVMRGGARLVSSRERSGSLRAFLLGAICPWRSGIPTTEIPVARRGQRRRPRRRLVPPTTTSSVRCPGRSQNYFARIFAAYLPDTNLAHARAVNATAPNVQLREST